jgi:hypothetical protein
MVQEMDRNGLLELELLDQVTHRALDAGSIHWLIGQRRLPVIAFKSGEEPDGVAMRDGCNPFDCNFGVCAIP